MLCYWYAILHHVAEKKNLFSFTHNFFYYLSETGEIAHIYLWINI